MLVSACFLSPSVSRLAHGFGKEWSPSDRWTVPKRTGQACGSFLFLPFLLDIGLLLGTPWVLSSYPGYLPNLGFETSRGLWRLSELELGILNL
ncbi:hypothetical protein IE53DRAFT_43076 [Violaceomyces palustris]|uniref:Uncharacterized protein n=1 Tax=Violaceomyces palustris TaxID=1673888 RepID=A0ACD0P0F2_9BASI|nr:hypothetical protein IE53DRAFT_43076 [Violaceomyces palustris]